MVANVFPVESPAYFPVDLLDVDVPGFDAGAFQAVVRQDTRKVLGVHRRGYHLIPNREIFSRFEDVLFNSGIDLQGLEVKDELAQEGRMVVRSYIFPAVQNEPKVGDIVSFALKVTNSYDGGAAFRAFMSGLRLVCTNGMVVPSDKSSTVYGRHTSGFSPDRAVTKILHAVDAFLLWGRNWEKWSDREIGPEDVSTVFESMPDINPRVMARLEAAWSVESGQAGNTVWALYNALTRWSTHAEVRPSAAHNRAAIVLDRESRVDQVIRGQAFRRLAV